MIVRKITQNEQMTMEQRRAAAVARENELNAAREADRAANAARLLGASFAQSCDPLRERVSKQTLQSVVLERQAQVLAPGTPCMVCMSLCLHINPAGGTPWPCKAEQGACMLHPGRRAAAKSACARARAARGSCGCRAGQIGGRSRVSTLAAK